MRINSALLEILVAFDFLESYSNIKPGDMPAQLLKLGLVPHCKFCNCIINQIS